MADTSSTKIAMNPDSVSQCVQASFEIMRLLRRPSSEGLTKVSRDIVSKLPNIKNTGELLNQMPAVIISLDTHLERGVHSAAALPDIKKLLLDDASTTE